MDPALRRSICRLVAGIAMSDDDFDPREDHFLERLLVDFGIPPEEQANLVPIAGAGEAAAEMFELPEEAKVEAMHLLLEAACADGRVMEAEREYLQAVGRTLGIGHRETDQMIAVRLAFR